MQKMVFHKKRIVVQLYRKKKEKKSNISIDNTSTAAQVEKIITELE